MYAPFISDLDVAALARGYGLLHLPSMPELKGRKFPDFVSTDVDYESIPYLYVCVSKIVNMV